MKSFKEYAEVSINEESSENISIDKFGISIDSKGILTSKIGISGAGKAEKAMQKAFKISDNYTSAGASVMKLSVDVSKMKVVELMKIISSL